MKVHALRTRLSAPFRKRRMEAFQKRLSPGESTTVVDVGGTTPTWAFSGPMRITVVNLGPFESCSQQGHFMFVRADGTQLPFGDASFDVAFSNSVIEHLGTWERQRSFAAELRRVGRSIWCQTPARNFFVEPHFLAPLPWAYPRLWRASMLRLFSVWGLLGRLSKDSISKVLQELRPLSYIEMQVLFPDCTIIRERFLGFTKSYIAVR